MATPLLAPKNGIPELVSTEDALLKVIEELKSGTGPLAIDAERASGFKYWPKAYLIQINRRGGGLHLIDPVGIGETKYWKLFNDLFQTQEWILHASTQDLPCLRDLGLDPKNIFDTELGGRLAGCERVGLGPLCESLLDIQLAKEHSAVDWSIRPLKEEWLNYAALDVEVLIDLRDKVENLLIAQNKLEIAKSEFSYILTLNLQPEKSDPWRRTSGMHKIRNRQSLALVRELWMIRNEYAARVDVASGRIFNDETLMEIVNSQPKSHQEFSKILLKKTRYQDLPTQDWYEKYLKALDLEDLPPMRGSGVGLPAIKIWEEKNPLGYARVTHARAQVAQVAAEMNMPVENLLSPDALRKLCWPEPPNEPSQLEGYIQAQLSQSGARKWQIDALYGHLSGALQAKTPFKTPLPEEGITQQ